MMKPYRYPPIPDDIKEERRNITRNAHATRESGAGAGNGSHVANTNGASQLPGMTEISDSLCHAFLATLPSITLDHTRIDPHLVTLCDSDPLSAQPYVKLVASLMSLPASRPPKRLLITSAKHGDGRTSVVLNLAGALAKTNLRVLVLDSDLSRPSMLRLLGVEVVASFPECLRRGLPLTEGMVRMLPLGFSLLPNRTPVENSAEVLRSTVLRKNLAALEEVYDFILFDSPPLLTSPDGQMLRSLVDKCLFVIRPGLTTPKQMAKALSTFDKDDFVGAILNRSVAPVSDE
jgi:Mrp family chromosome partitioning ATPase